MRASWLVFLDLFTLWLDPSLRRFCLTRAPSLVATSSGVAWCESRCSLIAHKRGLRKRKMDKNSWSCSVELLLTLSWQGYPSKAGAHSQPGPWPGKLDSSWSSAGHISSNQRLCQIADETAERNLWGSGSARLKLRGWGECRLQVRRGQLSCK